MRLTGWANGLAPRVMTFHEAEQFCRYLQMVPPGARAVPADAWISALADRRAAEANGAWLEGFI